MQAQQLEEFIQDVLIAIHANIRDLEEKRAFADPEEHEYIDGRIVGCNADRMSALL